MKMASVLDDALTVTCQCQSCHILPLEMELGLPDRLELGLELGFLLVDGLELGFEHGFLLIGGLDLRLELGLLDGLEFGL